MTKYAVGPERGTAEFAVNGKYNEITLKDETIMMPSHFRSRLMFFMTHERESYHSGD